LDSTSASRATSEIDSRRRAGRASRRAAWALVFLVAATAAPAAEQPSSSARSPAATIPGDPAGGAIGFYQRYLSALRHGHCRFAPSCSQYAAEAVHLYGVIEGTARAADRLMRCNAAAGRFYERLPDGRVVDPVRGSLGGRQRLRVPEWMLPAAARRTPPLAETGPGDPGRLDEIVSFAEALSREGDCGPASVEFRRAAHLTGTSEMHAWAYEKGGECYFHNEEWPLAETFFLKSGMLISSAEERATVIVLAAACRFNLGDFAAGGRLASAAAATGPAAGTVIASADPMLAAPSVASPEWSPQSADALGLLALTQMARGDWTTAGERFRSAAGATTDPTRADRWRFLAGRTPAGAALPRRSPTLAFSLSLLIPGAGQIYSGRTADGLRHFLVNTALIYSVAQLIRDDKYGAAYVVAGLSTPFYMGNLLGARQAARSFNRLRREEFVQASLEEAER